MRENCTSGSMRRGEKRVMAHSANGHRTRKGGNSGAPPGLFTNALVPLLYRSSVLLPQGALLAVIAMAIAYVGAEPGSILRHLYVIPTLWAALVGGRVGGT